jgi:hypothetical protein
MPVATACRHLSHAATAMSASDDEDVPQDEEVVRRHAQMVALVTTSCGCPCGPSANLFGIGPAVKHVSMCSHFANANIARIALADQWRTFCKRYGHPWSRDDTADREDPRILADSCRHLYSLIKTLPNQKTSVTMMSLLGFIEEVAWQAHSYRARMVVSHDASKLTAPVEEEEDGSESDDSDSLPPPPKKPKTDQN